MKKKIYFGFFMLFFLGIMLLFTLAYNNKFILSTGYVIKESTSMKGCVPNFPRNFTVVLRLDDIGKNRYTDFRFKLVDEVLSRDMSITIGVIPYGLEEDPLLVDYLLANNRNSQLEVAQHGYSHTENEFETISFQEANKSLYKGVTILNRFGVFPITFIPPSNVYSQDTISALNKQGFKIVSARENEYFFDGNLFYLGKTTETYDFYNKMFIPVDEILSECRTSFDLTNICVIVLHPQDYLTNGVLDDEKYASFVSLLQRLEEMNVISVNPRDFLLCPDNDTL